MTRLSIEYFVSTHTGLVRKENQDYFGIFPDKTDPNPTDYLFLVADGMGGHQGGQEASRLAVETVGEHYFSGSQEAMSARLNEAFGKANEVIFHQSNNNPLLFGMGTTCTAFAIGGSGALIAHVGDSRAYRISQDAITLLTEDHSHVAEMQRQGIISENEARLHPQRSVLTRALGTMPEVEVDLIENLTFEAGQSLLLCTDGLGKVDNATIKDIILTETPERACQALIEKANDTGGEDNATVLIVHFLKKWPA